MRGTHVPALVCRRCGNKGKVGPVFSAAFFSASWVASGVVAGTKFWVVLRKAESSRSGLATGSRDARCGLTLGGGNSTVGANAWRGQVRAVCAGCAFGRAAQGWVAGAAIGAAFPGVGGAAARAGARGAAR